MVNPVKLTIVESSDSVAEITAFVNKMNGYGIVRWVNIEETTQAWVEAGSVPSWIELEK